MSSGHFCTDDLASCASVICNLEKTRQFVNHSFNIMDPTWGHLTIKMSGHPPFVAQVILNGHEYVACTAHAAEVGFAKEGNCFTGIGEPKRLAQIADHLVPTRDCRAAGPGHRLLDLHRLPVLRPGPGRAAPQLLHLRLLGLPGRVPRNLIFTSGKTMERLFETIVDRTRARLDVPVRTLFGVGQRPADQTPSCPPAKEW